MTDNVAADFLPDELPDNPMRMLEVWLDDARQRALQPNTNATTLTTIDASGQPSARVVLCKAFDAEQGMLSFYTNYRSRKGQEIDANPNVALVFHWDHLGRQARIEGLAVRCDAAQSDAYFASRPRNSQIGAWASEQSAPVAGREAMVSLFEQRSGEFTNDDDIPRPPHWGGYNVWARACERWVEGAGRVHDRARFERELDRDSDGMRCGAWSATRLQP